MIEEYLEDLRIELANRGVDQRTSRRLLAEVSDHLQCDEDAVQRLGPPRAVAISLLEQLGWPGRIGVLRLQPEGSSSRGSGGDGRVSFPEALRWLQTAKPQPPLGRRTWIALLLVLALVAASIVLIARNTGPSIPPYTGPPGVWHQVEGVSGNLSGIGCASATDCWVVGGTSGANPQLVAAHLTRSGWVTAATPNDTDGATFNAVACPSSTRGYAVGKRNLIGTAGPAMLLATYTSGSWRLTPAVSGLGGGEMMSIACPGVIECWAVGQAGLDLGAFGAHAQILRMTGSGWSAVPTPGASSDSFLDSVVCPSTSSCFAVGGSWDSGKALVEQLTPAGWREVAIPGLTSSLDSVACGSPTACWTVGAEESATYSGSAWTFRSVSLLAGDGSQAISCLSASSCYVVGSSASTFAPAVVWLHDDIWTVVPSPKLDGDSLGAIACPAIDHCWAAAASGSIETNSA